MFIKTELGLEKKLSSASRSWAVVKSREWHRVACASASRRVKNISTKVTSFISL